MAQRGRKLFLTSAVNRKLAAILVCCLGQCALHGGQQAASEDLRIVIVDGDGFVNNIKRRTAREPVVEVRDRNDKPVAGAVVLFLLPGSGPGGTFPGGGSMLSVVTGANGRAAATGFTPNSVAGPYEIQVRATYQGRTATSVVRQRNVQTTGVKFWKSWGLVAVVAAAAVVGVVVATQRGGNGNGTGRQAGVSIGTPTVGPR